MRTGRLIGQWLMLVLAFGLGLAGCSVIIDDFDTDREVRCGDGVLAAPLEQCDGDNLAMQTCRLQGFYGGTLACNDECRYDTSGCRGRCGDGNIDPEEECEPEQFGTATCESLVPGATGGTLACDSQCNIDTSGCHVCGNGRIDGGESCDGTNMGAATCADHGFNGGTLTCTDQCDVTTDRCFQCMDNRCDAVRGETQDNCPEDCHYTDVSVGKHHACAIRADGSAWCWGSADYGALGVDLGAGVQLSAVPVRVRSSVRFTQVSAGYGFTCAIDEHGGVHCWGNNQDGQLGTASDAPESVDATAHTGSTSGGMQKVSAGSDFACAVGNAAAYCWGANTRGKLGAGASEATLSESSTPLLVDLSGVASNLEVVDVGVGSTFACAQTADWAVYCWGYNPDGLGDGVTTESLAPVQVDLSTQSDRSLTVGGFHACVVDLSEPAAVHCWGRNDHGQLGDGSQTPTNTPLTWSATPYDVLELFAGRGALCGVDAHTYGVYCVGDNSEGLVGAEITGCSGGSVLQHTPVQILNGAALADVGKISVGQHAACARTFGGRIYCWGGNPAGLLGIDSGSYECHHQAQPLAN